MDAKLPQRIVLNYYRAKFRLLEKLSLQKAAQSLMQLFFTPYSGRTKMERPAIFRKAQQVSFSFNGNQIKGFHWKQNNGSNKKILVCHGMNSRCYKFEKIIQLLLKDHYEVFAFDAQAHGHSEGKILNALIYSEMILEIEKRFGPLYGIVAHSVAGMAAALALEEIKNENIKAVLIAPAVETTTATDNFFQLLHLSSSMRTAFEAEITKVRGHPPQWYSVSRAVQNFSSRVLWIHDEDDLICPYKDVIPVKQMQLPHITIATTKELGHNKIYRDHKVQKMIIDFLNGERK
ncbi:MAG TPA: alpha/beta fold hydrolase [Chitinophagaceae bacterium]|nr:alpha/beta fold hydrolase [Chitinophagaceae bacterium]